MSCRVVFDTNVLIASRLSPHPASSNQSVLKLWEERKVTFLYSDDTLLEYIRKFSNFGFDPDITAAMVAMILTAGTSVSIDSFHLRPYPQDPDDIAFVLCAHNGNASHLLSHDRHLLDLNWAYAFDICTPGEFLPWFEANNLDGKI